MIYLLGANGNIGLNISNFFKNKGLEFIGVTKFSKTNNIDFKVFLKKIGKNKNNLVINAAILRDSDLESLINTAPKCTKIIHISSVSVYGNTNFSNEISPINDYGHLKVKEENLIKNNFVCCNIRLANIYGGNPETSGILKLYNAKNLKFIEVDENKNELIRDYVHIDFLLKFIYNNLEFTKSHDVNISTGIGMTSTEFLSKINLKIGIIRFNIFDKNSTIKTSIIDPSFINYT